jgi:hypothetical protein
MYSEFSLPRFPALGNLILAWQVEVLIPFAALGQSTPKPNDVWRANFYR